MAEHLRIVARKPKNIIHCMREGCYLRFGGDTQWQADRKLGEHVINDHVKPMWTRDAQKAS